MELNSHVFSFFFFFALEVVSLEAKREWISESQPIHKHFQLEVSLDHLRDHWR